MNNLITPDIPSEFKNVTIASTSFSKVTDPLNDFLSCDSVIISICTILITNHKDVIELVNGKVKRVEKINFENTKKVVVYHDFNLMRRFLVCLTTELTAYLLSYENFEVISQWVEVQDVSIDDPCDTGKPQLKLLSKSGNTIHLDVKDMLIGNQTCENSEGKNAATIALSNRIKASILHSQSMHLECERKELYIMRKLSDISCQLRTENLPPSSEASNVSNSKMTVRETLSQNKSSTSYFAPEELLLKVLTTRQRLVHGKWVICVSVINASDKYLVREPQLILYCSKPLNRLSYETKFMKTVQRKNTFQEQDSDIFVEQIEPPILRPGKRAFLIAICSMPDFSNSDKVSCSGLISFRVRSLRLSDAREDNALRQIPFPPVHFLASSTNSACIDLGRAGSGTGFSFDVLTLVASSVKHTLTIESLATPLNQVMTALVQHDFIFKMNCLNSFYYFNTSATDPIYYATFSCTQVSAHKLSLTTYTRDDEQCIILLHKLKKMFPKDVVVLSTDPESTTDFIQIQDNLISKMYESIAVISNAGQHISEAENNGNKKTKTSNECSYEVYEEERKKLKTMRNDIVWKASNYTTWRKSLHKLQIKMEQLYCSSMYE